MAASLSCHRDGKVISRGDMARIYARMYLLDQSIGAEWKYRHMADTTLVYEAVLTEYGYTVEDYRRSQEKYIRDPRRYTKMLKKSVGILESEKKLLKQEKDRLDALIDAKNVLHLFSPNRILMLDTLTFLDSMALFDFQKGLDTAYYGPGMTVWADTVNVEIQ